MKRSGRVGFLYADDQLLMNARKATISLMGVSVGDAIVINQFSSSRGSPKPSSKQLSTLLPAKGFGLIGEVAIELNFESELNRPLRKICEIDVLVYAQPHGARHLQLDGFFGGLLHLT